MTSVWAVPLFALAPNVPDPVCWSLTLPFHLLSDFAWFLCRSRETLNLIWAFHLCRAAPATALGLLTAHHGQRNTQLEFSLDLDVREPAQSIQPIILCSWEV
jgi:hypothetical protein